MKKIFWFLLLTLNFISAQEKELMNKFEIRTHTFNATTIPYRLFVPKKEIEKKFPLIIALHGAGERGNDNQKQIKFHRIATVWADSTNQEKHPCFVVAPQCPKKNKWVDTDWKLSSFDFNKTPISNELATVIDLVDSLIENYPIDIHRIYVTGLSMGGFGSWYLLFHNPQKYAGAIIMSGAGDPQMACAIREIPIWNFHGDADKVVPVEGSRRMMKAISDCGKDVLLISNPNNKSFLNSDFEKKRILESEHIYTEYKGKGHAIWKESYSNWLVREWLFSKKLN